MTAQYIISVNRPESGLGNRMRAVLGAKSLADTEGRRFAYTWPTGDAFGPRLQDLWHFDAPVVSWHLPRAMKYIWPYRDETLQWLDDDARDSRLWLICTPSALHLPARAEPWDAQFRALAPVPAISARVEAFFDEHLRGRPYVGVMVRAHQRSHPRTAASSPVQWFIERMQRFAEEQPGIRFFVSCDVPQVAADIVAAVPGAVTQTDKGGYNSVEGVQASVADLYLLAGSGYLIGPYYSSFIELASFLAAERLTVENSVETHGDGRFLPALAADPLRPALRP